MHQSCILLVEDSDAHARLVESVLEELREPVQLYRAASVDQALEFLSQAGTYSSVPVPDLVLLDLNMPLKTGYDLLAAMLADSALKDIRVVIFSSADHADDRAKSLSRGAYAHIGKPWTYIGYEAAMREVLQMVPDGKSRSSGR
jgi:two-component system, chemotaxis family, response regulator Rcp1